jgi:hypothetical protein
VTEPAETSWRCSYPTGRTPPDGFANGAGGLLPCGWGPIPASEPVAQGRDFGNWLPAQLTVEKQLTPTDDPGRFDLKVNTETVVPGAGDRASWTDKVKPGSYDITEQAVPGTDPDAYNSSVTCQTKTRQRGRVRAGTSYQALVLQAGDHATCTFINVVEGAPAIAIEKDGPLIATAGDTLHYTFYVTNPGDVPLSASNVHVSDDTCDQPPERVGKADRNGRDDTPGQLNPGDTWTYKCSHKTQAPTTDCTASTFTNTATATGSANGTTVKRQDEHTTTLRCPNQPTQPPLPTPPPPNPTPTPTPDPNPGPTPPAPVVAAGVTPPPAGLIGVAGLRVSPGCVARVSQVRLLGTRVSLIRVSVDGRRVNTERLRILQHSATPLPRLFGAGRHRLTVRVRFELGSSSPAVTLSRSITICAAHRRQPHFTG